MRQQSVSLPILLFKDLLLSDLFFLGQFDFQGFLSLQVHLSLEILLNVGLFILHLLLSCLSRLCLLIKLSLDLHEESLSFLSLVLLLLDLLEDMSQFVAKIQQIFMHLHCLVKCDDFLVMIGDSHDKTTTIALIDQALNHVPASIEIEHFLKRTKLDILEEVLALLEHPNGQGLLDEGTVLL